MSQHRIGFEGAPNFRDLGAALAGRGPRLLPGRVFRSESLAGLTDADLAELRGLKIGLLYDLRAPDERERQPNRWPAGVPLETVAGLDGNELAAVRFAGWRQRLYDPGFDADAARHWLTSAYADMPRIFGSLLGAVFDRLAAPTPPAILLHCTAGKDRTGFVCAMLLFALEVPREDVFADYLLTGELRPPADLLQTLLGDELHALAPAARAALGVMAGVDAAYLETALAAIGRQFGHVDAYLQQACGLTPAKRERLQSQLLY